MLQKAREALLASGAYEFKKGRSRSKSLPENQSNSDDSSAKKRRKIDKETRHARVKDVEENICDIDEEITYKERRRSQAENVRDYRQCDEITERLPSLKEKKRLLKRELSLLQKKESQAQWYQKKRSHGKKHDLPGFSSDTSDISYSTNGRSSPQSHDVIDLSQASTESLNEENQLSDKTNEGPSSSSGGSPQRVSSDSDGTTNQATDNNQDFRKGLLLSK